MGILDVFDHPDILNYLLGGSPQPPNVPANPPAGPPVGPAPGQTFTGTPQQNYNMAQGGFPTYTDQTQWNPPRATVPDVVAQTGMPGAPGAAAASPGPDGGAGGLPQRGTVPDTIAPVGPQIAASPPQQGPIESAPPPPPPAAAPGQLPPTATQGGNLMRAFGLNPGQLRAANPLPTISPMQNFMGGLGAGLSTVGGNTAGGAFARGMGGGITGGLRQNQVQTQNVRQAQNDLFNQSNVAYRDMLAAYARDDAHALTAARSNWLNAGAQMRQMGGKDAFSGTPYAKSLNLERGLDQEDDRMRKSAKEDFDVSIKGGADPQDALKTYNDAKQKIDASRDQRRKERAQRMGIDPNGYLNGVDKDHAFDMDKLSPAQRLQMPDGAWYSYKGDDGKTQYSRRDYGARAPYPGYQAPPSGLGPPQPPQQAPSPARTYDAQYGQTDEAEAA